MPKWVYPLAFLFVLFLIFTEPTGASNAASGFADFAVTLLGSVGEFLTGLFEGASDGSRNGAFEPNAGPTSTVLEQLDSFTHTHDGSTHTHSN